MFATQVTRYKIAYARLLDLHKLMQSGIPAGTVHSACTYLVDRYEEQLDPHVAERVRRSIDKAFGIEESDG